MSRYVSQQLIDRLDENAMVNCCVIFSRPIKPEMYKNGDGEINESVYTSRYEPSQVIFNENKKWSMINRLINHGYDYYVHEMQVPAKYAKSKRIH